MYFSISSFKFIIVVCYCFRRHAPLLEGLRCAMYFILEIILQDVLTSNIYLMYILRALFLASTLLWAANLRVFTPELGKKHKVYDKVE